jgi:hypothetical protein
MEFTTRAYNSFEINPKTKASIIKTSGEERLKNECLYYRNLPKDLQVYFPRLIDYDFLGEYRMELEYYAYNNLGNQMISSQYDEQFWEKVFDFLLGYINAYKNSSSMDGNSTDVLLMTVDKTEKEYVKLFDQFEFFKNLKDEKEFVLNGKVLKSFDVIWGKISEYIKKNLTVDKFYYIHGDLCFSNILYGVNPITKDLILKMIDPRGSFGNTKYFGDPYYDLAKISHSCSGGYEYFIYDKFNVDVDKNSFNLTFSSGNVKDSINDKFINLVNRYGFNYEAIKLIEGCIYVGMCARHYDSLERQKAMYITGLNILNEIYETI